MTEDKNLINETAFKDLTEYLKDKVKPEDIDKMTKNILDSDSNSSTKTYYADFEAMGALFYSHFGVHVYYDNETKSKKFNGNAGGLTIILFGRGAGQVYTEDIEKLFKETTNFAFIAAAVYFSVYFYDDNHNLLGHFQAGGIGNCSAGGGTGTWK